MKFNNIEDSDIVSPGEYVFYEPRQEVVLCGAFNRKENFIKVLCRGQLVEDEISKFKKIQLTVKEKHQRRISRCKGCSN